MIYVEIAPSSSQFLNYVEIAPPPSQFLNYVVKVTTIKDTMPITVKIFEPIKVTTIKKHNANNSEDIRAEEGDICILKHEELKLARIKQIKKYSSDLTILVKVNNVVTKRPSHVRRLGFLCRGPKVDQ